MSKGTWGKAYYGSVLHFWKDCAPERGRYERQTICGKWLIVNRNSLVAPRGKCPRCKGKYAKMEG